MARLKSLGLALALALLLARLGPFGTFSDLPPAQRVAYWLGLTLLLWVQLEIARRLLGGGSRGGRWGRAVAAAALASVPSAFEVAWAESLLRVERDLGPLDLLFIYGDVLLVALALALLLELAEPGQRRATPAKAPAPGEAERLTAALPPERRGEIRAIAAEDHYLRVYTDRGEALILRRFGDALADVAGLDGLRVHRSWWVSRAAVARLESEGERLTLILVDGRRVPVSRTYQLVVRQAGFPDR